MGNINETVVNPARQYAFRSLLKMKSGKYTNLEINTTLQRNNMSPEDKSLYTRLTYGVVERIITLDTAISQYSDIPLEKISEEALCALRMGFYQLMYCDRIPDHAAVNETVELCPKKQKSFVNAIIRSFIRNGKKVKITGTKTDKLTKEYSVPKELCLMFYKWYGDECEDIFKAFFENSKISLRLNTLKENARERVELLNGSYSKIAKNSITVQGFEGVATGIEEGLWFVQDEASTLCAELSEAKKGDFVIDTCAAPGGKSFSMALNMENCGRVLSMDIHNNKLSLIKKGAAKMGITIIETLENDARNPIEEYIGKADKVLCDAPCSGLGVIGKKPDIKYKDVSQIKKLPEIQFNVLCGASKYVKPGGTLIYSTCTVNPDENEMVLKKFLSENTDFKPYPFEYKNEKRAWLTLLPSKDKTDGFFIGRMKKEI